MTAGEERDPFSSEKRPFGRARSGSGCRHQRFLSVFREAGVPRSAAVPGLLGGRGFAPGDPRSSTSAAKPQRTSLLSRVNCLEASSAPAGAPAAASGPGSHPRLWLAVTSSLPVVSLSTSSQAHAQATPDLRHPCKQQLQGSEDPGPESPTSISAPPHPESAPLHPAQGQP